MARRRPPSSRRRGRPSGLGLLLLALFPGLVAASFWAFYWEPARLHNEDHVLLLDSWPAACDGLRVAVLSDLHVGSPGNGRDKLREIVRVTRAAEPDLVLLAGDFVIHGVLGGHFVEPEVIALELSRLAAPLGVFAVLGNHDHWFDGPRVRRALEAVRIPVLADSSRRLVGGACRPWLLGLRDLWTDRPNVEAAFASLPVGAHPVIVLTHHPDLFPEIPDRADLTIAGHTHGGQVHLPLLGRPIVPSRFGERFAAGHVVEGGRHLFVSTGLGTSILPVRFRVPPEVSVLELRSTRIALARGASALSPWRSGEASPGAASDAAP